MEAAVVGARIAQFVGASVLFGVPLFFLYSFRGARDAALRWPGRLVTGSACIVALAAVVALVAQTGVMAGDPAAALDRETLQTVALEMGFGRAVLVRLTAAGLALALCLSPWGRGRWAVLSLLGAIVLASFAWTGHGAAEEGARGRWHAVADVLHLLAAGVWLGALAAFAMLVRPGARLADGEHVAALHKALAGFSGVGSLVVAVIVATGLVNSWFLVGPERIGRLTASTYGVLLLTKIALFLGMLLLAAVNRFRHTPELARALAARESPRAIAALRRSVFLETTAGLLVLILVSVLGTLAPVSAQ